MKVDNPNLVTPIYVKDEAFIWPENEDVFYLLSSDGLFICRNHKWFRSCVKANRPPGELEPQKPFLQTNYPKVPAWMINKVIAWFYDVAHKFHCEAAALLIWDEDKEVIKLHIPKQTGKTCKRYAMDVVYEIPQDLPLNERIIGTIHSHVFASAYSSFTDKGDEEHFPGVHIVIGELNRKEPDVHAVIVADGNHFKVEDIELIVEPFDHTLPGNHHNYPKWWWERLHCEVVQPPKRVYYTDKWQKNMYGGGHGFGGYGEYGEYGQAAHVGLDDVDAEEMEHLTSQTSYFDLDDDTGDDDEFSLRKQIESMKPEDEDENEDENEDDVKI